jgi:hypothetical protein
MTLPFRNTRTAGALAVAALLVSTGCATTKRVPLGEENAQRLKTVRPVAALAQQELKTSIVVSNAGAGFGLIGALIDTSVNNSAAKGAEAKVVPVRNALIGWEAGAALRAALEREVVPVALLHVGKIEVQQLPDAKDAIAKLVEGTKEDALFLVQTDYRLSPAFDRIVITAKASLLRAKLPPTSAEQDAAADGSEPKPLYANTFVTSTALPGFVAGKTTLDEAAALWAAEQGRAARTALEVGMNEVARMIAFDIVQIRTAGPNPPEPKYEAPAGAATLTSVGPNAQGTLSGFAVRQEKGRAWLRASTGELAVTEAP